MYPKVETQEYDKVPQSFTALSVAIGIFFFSFAGHPCLPEVYFSMKEPKEFENVVKICFVVMFLVYCTMALCGYLQFGRETSVVITANLVNDSGSPSEVMIGKVLIGFIVASCYFQVSPILAIVAGIPEDLYSIEKPLEKRVFRTFLFAAIVAASWFIREHLGTLVAVTGSVCTTVTSAIGPALFYYGLNKNKMSSGEIGFLLFFLFCGLSVGLFTFYNDIWGLISGTE